MNSIILFMSLLPHLAIAQNSTSGKQVDLGMHYSIIPESDEQKLKKGFVKTRESFVNYGGVNYRQIEYEGKFYLVDLRQPADFYHCRDTSFVEAAAVEAQVKVTQRTRVFVETLMQHCNRKADRIDTNLDLSAGKFGVKIKGDKPDSGEKKVYVSPASKNLGFGSTF